MRCAVNAMCFALHSDIAKFELLGTVLISCLVTVALAFFGSALIQLVSSPCDMYRIAQD